MSFSAHEQPIGANRDSNTRADATVNQSGPSDAGRRWNA